MNNNNPQLHLFQVSEIRVSYQPKIPPKERPQIRSSQTCYDIFMNYWDLNVIEYEEQFCTMYVNRANRVIGIHKHSTGGVAGTVVDAKQILAVALKSNASGIILCHNHPSSNLRPSQADLDITSKIKSAAKTMDLNLLDHLIITPHGYYSFADEGVL
jgi:DNA repair protein RadC